MRSVFDCIRIPPGSAHLTAIEAMGDLFRTLPEHVGKEWLRDSRFAAMADGEMRDPFDPAESTRFGASQQGRQELDPIVVAERAERA
jgi:hypothetical protein